MSHARIVPALLAVAMVVAGCGGGPAPVETTTATPTTAPSPSPTVGPTAGPTPTATATASPEATTPTSAPTDDDTLVLAGQFTAFVGADGSGPACDAFWWADALGGQPYVGLSDDRDVTAAGRVEPLCLLGFDGEVELTVTDPFGEVRVLDLDATQPDGGVGVLEVSVSDATPGAVVLAALQVSPSPAPSPSDDDGSVVAQAETSEAPSGQPSEQPSEAASEDPTSTATEFTESEDELDAGGVQLAWQVPADARGQYTFSARQGGLAAEAGVTVVSPTRLEVGPEAEGTRTVTLRDGPGEAVPVGLYAVEDEFGSFVDADGFRGRDFVLVEDLGTLADGESTVVDTTGLDAGRYCVTSPAVQFVDCRPDEGSDVVPGSGWFQ